MSWVLLFSRVHPFLHVVVFFIALGMCSFLKVQVVGWAQRCWPFFSKCSVGGFTFVVAMAITAADHGAAHSQARS